jgi:hypothetical protein
MVFTTLAIIEIEALDPIVFRSTWVLISVTEEVNLPGNG